MKAEEFFKELALAFIKGNNTLYERESRVLEAYYVEGKKTKEIADEFKLSPPRILQIKERAERRYIKMLNYTSIQSLRAELEATQRQLDAANATLSFYQHKLNTPLGKAAVTFIDDLPISVRAATIMKSARIRTVAELCDYTEEDIMRFRNMGLVTLLELKNVLAKMGLALKPNSTPNPETCDASKAKSTDEP